MDEACEEGRRCNNAEQAWYYFTSDGKAASDSWQKISDKCIISTETGDADRLG